MLSILDLSKYDVFAVNNNLERSIDASIVKQSVDFKNGVQTKASIDVTKRHGSSQKSPGYG